MSKYTSEGNMVFRKEYDLVRKGLVRACTPSAARIVTRELNELHDKSESLESDLSKYKALADVAIRFVGSSTEHDKAVALYELVNSVNDIRPPEPTLDELLQSRLKAADDLLTSVHVLHVCKSKASEYMIARDVHENALKENEDHLIDN